MGGGNRNTKGSRHKQSNCTAGIGAEATGLVEFGDAVTHGLYDTPTAEHGTEAHRRVARKYDPAGNGIGGLGYTRSDQQHPDDADGFLRIIAAVSKAIGRSRQQLETPEVFSIYPDFPVYGSICEGHEQLWRIIGSENTFMWMGLYPDELGAFISRIGEFLVEMTKAQIKAAGGMLDGMVIWGDVAYRNGMLFSPVFWREHFKPIVKEQIRVCHEAGIPVIYHGCGNATMIYDDFIEIGLDAYNPLEAKSGLDVVEIRKKYGHEMGFCGNIDALAWANDSLDELKAQVLRKLNAAKGGGYIVQSDHSVPSNVSAERYGFVVDLVKKYGKYPLDLGEYDIPGMDVYRAGRPAGRGAFPAAPEADGAAGVAVAAADGAAAGVIAR